MKLTRKQISEGLKEQPLEKLLLGTDSKTTRLTSKQLNFARDIAAGETKAQAYRNNYDSKAAPAVQANEAYKLSLNPHIATMIDQLKTAKAASEYLLPAHLRSLIVQKLTEKALNDDIKTSDQLRAIELLGKLTEVSAFTERKEIIKQADSNEARAKLINAITNAIKTTNSLADDKRASAESLLNEIANARQPVIVNQVDQEPGSSDQVEIDQVKSQAASSENDQGEDPPPATSPNQRVAVGQAMHTIPDKQSEEIPQPDEDRWWEDPPVNVLNENDEKNI